MHIKDNNVVLKLNKYNFEVKNVNINLNNKKKKQKYIWFNPPFYKLVTTNLGKKSVNIISEHFGKNSKLKKIINKNHVKLIFSCMPKLVSIIKNHNKKLTATYSEKPKSSYICKAMVETSNKTKT